jgi:hypothetical protein
MKNQISIINVAGAAVSASLLVSSFFLPSVSAFSFPKRITIPQIQKIPISKKQMNNENNKKTVPAISSASEISTHINHKEIFQEKIASIDEPKQELNRPEVKCMEVSKPIDDPKQEINQPEVKCEEVSKSNGCSKNLDYFTMRPRPKQMPEECFTCENIITCVCLPGKQSN